MPKIKKKILGDLNMSKLEQRPFEEQLANVIYANRLEQAETRGKEEGIEQGIEQGERNIITKLLKKNTPEEIYKIYNIPLEKIQKVQNSKSI
jgi:predicted transposase YdaD